MHTMSSSNLVSMITLLSRLKPRGKGQLKLGEIISSSLWKLVSVALCRRKTTLIEASKMARLYLSSRVHLTWCLWWSNTRNKIRSSMVALRRQSLMVSMAFQIVSCTKESEGWSMPILSTLAEHSLLKTQRERLLHPWKVLSTWNTTIILSWSLSIYLTHCTKTLISSNIYAKMTIYLMNSQISLWWHYQVRDPNTISNSSTKSCLMLCSTWTS